jgi:hypothetical protein
MNDKINAVFSTSVNRLQNTTPKNQSRFWFQRLLHCCNIGQKINLSYAIVLGIAVTGTVIGLIYSDRYHCQALNAIEDEIEEIELMHRLQSDLLQIQVHQQQLSLLLNNPQSLKNKSDRLREYIADLQTSWMQFKLSEGATKGDEEYLLDEVEINRQFLQSNRAILDAYLRELNVLLRQLDISNLTISEKRELHQQLHEFGRKPIVFQIER